MADNTNQLFLIGFAVCQFTSAHNLLNQVYSQSDESLNLLLLNEGYQELLVIN